MINNASKKNIFFSTLSYYPAFLSTDIITVGIVFFNVDNNLIKFETTTNWNRIKTLMMN